MKIFFYIGSYFLMIRNTFRKFTKWNVLKTLIFKEIDDLIKKLQPLGLASASRTGVVAMTKGSEIYKQH